MPRSINDTDNFYDWLVDTKDQNLTRVRNSAVMPSSGSRNPVVIPTPQEPSLINDFAERKAINEIKEESKESWQGWQTKQATAQATPLIIGSLAYYFFFR